MLDVLLEPNLAYLLLMVGFWLAMMGLLSPGTGLYELGALVALLLAGLAVVLLPVNWWALAILLFGVLPALYLARFTRRLVYLRISVGCLIIGSAFLFRGEGWLPAVDPLLLAVTSLVIGGVIWIVTRKMLEAEQAQPTHDLGRLIGKVGEARTDIYLDGTVYMDGELWSAQSRQPIPNGAPVKVVGRDGFVLEVERLEAPVEE